MPEIVDIDVSSLLFDMSNARYEDEPTSQQSAAIDLAEKHGDHVLTLARDIVEHGMDPLALPAVVASGDTRKRYTVVEGNRRLVAIKALETPTLIAGALSPSQRQKLTELAKRYIRRPIPSLKCVPF